MMQRRAHCATVYRFLHGSAFTSRFQLLTGKGLDLTPSMHWPVPILSSEFRNDVGPVLITVLYCLDPNASRDAFLQAISRLGRQRGRDGAYRWGIYADSAEPDIFTEVFLVESWMEHMRQHERVTNTDRMLQEYINSLLTTPPEIWHLISTATTQEPAKHTHSST